MKQLQVHNPNTGEWWEMGVWEKGQAQGIYPRCDGAGAYKRAYDGRNYAHPLTKIDMPLEWKLGGELLASVPGKYRDRVVAWRKANGGEEVLQPEDMYYVSHATSSRKWRIILRPEAPPAKTAEDWLEELTDELEVYVRSSQWEKLKNLVRDAKKHLEATKPSAE